MFLSCFVLLLGLAFLSQELPAQDLFSSPQEGSASYSRSLSVFAGYSSHVFRDITQIGPYLNASGVSPVKLTGKGPSFNLLYRVDKDTRTHRLGLSINAFGSFVYDSGIIKTKRPDEEFRTEIKMSYHLDFHKFKNVLFRHLNIGLGPQVYLAYYNTGRNFSPNIEITLREGHFSPAFVFSINYLPPGPFRVEIIASNGVIVGLGKTYHNELGAMPRLNGVVGWLTETSLGASLLLTSHLELGIKFRRADQGAYALFGPYYSGKHEYLINLSYRLGV